MNMFLAFAPFIAFALLERVSGVVPALCAAAAISAALLVRDWMSPTRKVKLLEIGTLVLFGGLAVYELFVASSWSVLDVRLRVDLGLLIVVLVSLAVRQPFTLQYAKERAPPEVWREPRFMHVNVVLTSAWALAFAAMVLADIMMIYVPGVPLSVGIVVTVAAVVGAFKFTDWYVARATARAPGAGKS
jgi:hypothetical protein